jgi:hypothetical protein
MGWPDELASSKTRATTVRLGYFGIGHRIEQKAGSLTLIGFPTRLTIVNVCSFNRHHRHIYLDPYPSPG